MLIEITQIAYTKATNEVSIKGIELESLLLNDWDTEMELSEKEFYFDLTKEGHRLYLYKVIQSHGKKEAKTLLEKMDSLVGKTIHMNTNFLKVSA